MAAADEMTIEAIWSWLLSDLPAAIVPVMLGLCLGALWTLVFGPMLGRVRCDRRNWFAYAAEAVGVFVMVVALYKLGIFTPLRILAAMVSAGIGMFLVKGIVNGDLAE